MILYWFLISLCAAYVLLMLLYRMGWFGQEDFNTPSSFVPTQKISIIVPARNEEAHIQTLLVSLLAQEYPPALFEIIVVDDHSEDDTVALAMAFKEERIRCIRLQEVLKGQDAGVAYKKLALSAGIAQSKGSIILTTDADCTLPSTWLLTIAAGFERYDAAMLAAPVNFIYSDGVVGLFQSLDFMTMQGITVAAHRFNLGGMANGANLAFTRASYDAVHGYIGTTHLASGDDYLLLAKMKKKFPKDIHFIKSKAAIVQTVPQPDWGSFLAQRIRWASKSGKYPDAKLTAILMFVYAFNVALLAATVALIFLPDRWTIVLAIWLTKTVIELCFLYPVAAFFNKRKELIYFPLLQTLHVVYIVAAGFLGMAGGYRWKGRRVN